ncbi:hypothetical protein F4804DRAFT_337392 [Jackrogersella minutella]|nr:hypothetical protein F4804DRAFT_337392 [Jackrogersella minutella]
MGNSIHYHAIPLRLRLPPTTQNPAPATSLTIATEEPDLPITGRIQLPEILLKIGSHVHHRETMLNLCLVSKAFNQIFSEILYEELEFSEANMHWLLESDKTKLLCENHRLVHARRFGFCIYKNIELRNASETDMVESAMFPSELSQSLEKYLQMDAAVVRILPNMTRLKSFTWLGFPLIAKTLSLVQKSCPQLEDLTIVFPANLELRMGLKLTRDFDTIQSPDFDEWDDITDRFMFMDLPAFSNLKRLHLHNLWGLDLPHWRSILVRLFLASPGLVDLGLSMSSAMRWRFSNFDQHRGLAERHPGHFLRELCLLYRKRGGKPLALQSLNLGHCMFVLRPGNTPDRVRPKFPEEHENGAELANLVDLSQIQELSLDLVHDQAFLGPRPEGFIGDLAAKWWPTMPGHIPKLTKLSVRMPTTWFVRWAKGIVDNGAPLRQIKVHEASLLGLTNRYTFDFARRSRYATLWSSLLCCKPQELMFYGGNPGSTEISLDEVLSCKSIRYLATEAHNVHTNLIHVARSMPQLEGLWLMDRCDEHHLNFYNDDRGGIQDILNHKYDWEMEVREIAEIMPKLKYVRMCAISWRIKRTVFGVSLQELDRSENETEIPDLFRISIPYMFDESHAAKFWVDNRLRDEDEVM